MDCHLASSPTKSVSNPAIANSSVDSQFLKALKAPISPYRRQLCPRTVPYSQFPNGQYKPLFSASGDWAWLNSTDIVAFTEKIIFRDNLYTTAIKRGNAGDRVISYLVKSWRHAINEEPRTGTGMFTELYLYMKRFEDLLGTVIPKLIAVQRSPEELHFIMELPHHSFWIEASSDMPDVLKERVVQALARIHEEGILLGDISLSNFLVTGEGNVFVINFHRSRSNQPSFVRCVHLSLAYPNEFVREMELLKHQLKYRSPINQSSCAPSKPPRLFVAPGQSREGFQQNLHHFLKTFMKLDKEYPSQPQVIPGSSLGLPISGVHVTSTEIPPSEHYNLRKRKQTRDFDKDPSVNGPRKRARMPAQERPSLNITKHDKKALATSPDLPVETNDKSPALPPIFVRDFALEQRDSNPRAIVWASGHVPEEPAPSLEHSELSNSHRGRSSVWDNTGSFLKERFPLVGGAWNRFIGLVH